MTALAVSRDGQRVYAARRGALDVIDANAMVARARIDLGRRASGAALAVSGDATRALVVLDAKSVGVVDLVRFRLHRRIELPGATGAAFAPTGSTAYVEHGRPAGLAPGAPQHGDACDHALLSARARPRRRRGAQRQRRPRVRRLGRGQRRDRGRRPARRPGAARAHGPRAGPARGVERRHARLRRRRRLAHGLGAQRAVLPAPDRPAPGRVRAAHGARGAAGARADHRHAGRRQHHRHPGHGPHRGSRRQRPAQGRARPRHAAGRRRRRHPRRRSARRRARRRRGRRHALRPVGQRPAARRQRRRPRLRRHRQRQGRRRGRQRLPRRRRGRRHRPRRPRRRQDQRGHAGQRHPPRRRPGQRLHQRRPRLGPHLRRRRQRHALRLLGRRDDRRRPRRRQPRRRAPAAT